MRAVTVAALGLAVLSLAACGSRPGERALTGAGVGGAVGAAGTAIVGGPIIAGAAVGAGAGAALGALTSQRDLDLRRLVD